MTDLREYICESSELRNYIALNIAVQRFRVALAGTDVLVLKLSNQLFYPILLREYVMSESAPVRNQLYANLTDNQWVTITAIGLAVVAFILVSLISSPLPVSADFSAEFLLSLSIMDLAFSYNDYWPVKYRPVYAVMWTLIFGIATMFVFLGVYALGLSQVGKTIVSVAAFLITVGLQFGSAMLYGRIR